MNKKLRDLSKEELELVVSQSDSYKDILRNLGYRPNSGSMLYIIKRLISEKELDISHFGSRYREKISKGVRKYQLVDILIKDSPYTNIWCLKKRLISENILEYKCRICGNTGSWLGNDLTLQLNHIDGDPRNHTISNLEFLCPNCHTQTDTYSGRNKMKKSIL